MIIWIYIGIYALVASIFESVNFYLAFRIWKFNKDAQMVFKFFRDGLMQIKSYQLLKKYMWNWYMIILIYIPLFILLSSLIFPMSLFRKLRLLIFGKTKLEKEAEQEKKALEEAKRKSDEFLQNEGIFFTEDFPSQDIIEEE